jgi:hypothetical protein
MVAKLKTLGTEFNTSRSPAGLQRRGRADLAGAIEFFDAHKKSAKMHAATLAQPDA